MNDLCEKWNLNFDKLPSHVAIVMDGNGRWAQKKNLPRIAGHKKGVERVQEITEFCGNIGIKALTLYAFSEENWKRPEDEILGIMSLLRFYIKKESKNIIEKNVRFKMIGNRKKIALDILVLIEDLEKNTRENTGMHLTIALSYSSQSEMVQACQMISQKVLNKEIKIEEINSNLFQFFLETSNLPSLDLFIRTSGEYRVSNFLLWQLAYAELFFEENYWPNFTTSHMARILKDYENRERRFGLTSFQIHENNKNFLGENP